MTGRGHATIGLAIGLLAAAQGPNDPLLRAGIIWVAFAASLLPDIDHPRAVVSGWLPGVGHATRLFVSHRGGTHTVIFAAAIVALLTFINAPVPIVTAAAAGIVSHLLADMTTPRGVPLLLPVSRRAFMLAPRPILGVSAWIIEAITTVCSLVLMFYVVTGGFDVLGILGLS